MNILIADSGSTKTEWVLLNSRGEKSRFNTVGLNPYFLTGDQIVMAIKEGLDEEVFQNQIDVIHFYGAGCGRSSSQEVVQKALSTCFVGAEVHVESDLLAAAKACFGDSPGIVCILGTGSNSCVYDGSRITEKIPSLGFTLGDEGSGGYFGKKILQSYFYKIMPEDLRIILEKQHDMGLDSILTKVYKEPNGNRFVASFAQLLGDHSEHPFIKKMVREGFEEFAQKQLSYFEDIEGIEGGFVGSIAAVHAETLQDVLEEYGVKLLTIVRKPIEALADYYLKIQAAES
ncbi:MAG: BadF/BadG/BcrA/BcrD ATPase family protein [Balneolaceae bacterium]